ncbi:hypothetical protein R1flu_013009 [Riccia fluitans]|uniref:Uncharacterized protein n=1 Tax=Riccia fluitans TaxID=41844 RepID=A0ABD1ZGA4_9MARC
MVRRTSFNTENLLQADSGKGGMMEEDTWIDTHVGEKIPNGKVAYVVETSRVGLRVKPSKVEKEASSFSVGIEEVTKVVHRDKIDSDTKVGVTKDVKVEDIEIEEIMGFRLMDSRMKIQDTKMNTSGPKDRDEKIEAEGIFQTR